MAFTIQMDETDNTSPVMIKVIGIGGGGCNALKQMMDFDLHGVELIVANTDKQVLQENPIQNKLQLGVKTTRGMGAGSKPEVGRAAAEEDRDKIRDALNGADMVFIAAGMGGGTGTGAAPVIANVARDMGILTVAIVTKPFTFEGMPRMRKAEAGLEVLKSEVDCLVIIPNDRISAVMGEDATLIGSFKTVDNVLRDAVYSIATIIQKLGVINTDLEDVKTIMSERGIAMMGSGEAKGEDRARAATEKAISSPLLEASIDGAHGVLLSFQSGENFSLQEMNQASKLVQEAADPSANIIFGHIIDDSLGDVVRVTVIAAGFDEPEDEQFTPASRPAQAPPARSRTFEDSVPSHRAEEPAIQPVSTGQHHIATPSHPVAEPVARTSPAPARSIPPVVEEPTTRSSRDLDIPAFLFEDQ